MKIYIEISRIFRFQNKFYLYYHYSVYKMKIKFDKKGKSYEIFVHETLDPYL